MRLSSCRWGALYTALVIAMGSCVTDTPVNPTPVLCTVTAGHLWLGAYLSASQDTRYCPVAVSSHSQVKFYNIIIQAADYIHLMVGQYSSGTGYSGNVRFRNYVQNSIPNMSDKPIFFQRGSGDLATANPTGSYYAASDESHGLTGIDYAKIFVYLNPTYYSGDSAQASAEMSYSPYSSATLSGPTSGVQSQDYGFNVNAANEFKPTMVEWFIDDVSQGDAAYDNITLGHTWYAAGSYTVKAHIIPSEDSDYPTPYDLTLQIDISQESCGGGPGQTPCISPPIGTGSNVKSHPRPKPSQIHH